MTKQTDITYAIPSQPRQLRLDSTSFCNARCLSCHRYLSKREGNMSLDMMRAIFDDVARWPQHLEELVPVNYGEFFSLSGWRAILQLCETNLPHTQVVIPTNGFYLNDDAVKDLAEYSVVKIINFSVNAFFEDTYEKFMGLPADNIDRMKHAIKLLHAIRPDMFFSVSMVNDVAYQTDLERDYFIESWQAFLKEVGASYNVQVLPAASAGRPGQKPAYPVKAPCRSLFADIVVGFDGKLSSCCFNPSFDIDLGEYHGDLKKDWMNDKISELRRVHNEHQRDTISRCKVCTFA